MNSPDAPDDSTIPHDATNRTDGDLPMEDATEQMTDPMTDLTTPGPTTPAAASTTGNRSLQRHRTDYLAFLFGLFFVACAGLAFAVQSWALDWKAGAGAWIAGTVLVTVGLLAVLGTVVTGSRPEA